MTPVDPRELDAFLALRAKLFAALEGEYACFDLVFPGAWNKWGIRLRLYKWIDRGEHSWHAPTLAECIARADADISAWIAEAERERAS